MHTLKLNDLELTALMIHFEGQNEMIVSQEQMMITTHL